MKKIKTFELFKKVFVLSPIKVLLMVILTIIVGLIPLIEVKALAKIGDYIASLNFLNIINLILLVIFCKIINSLLNYLILILKNKITLKIYSNFEKQLIEKTLKIELREKEKDEYANVSQRAFEAINPEQLICIITSLPNVISGAVTCISLCLILFSINMFLPLAVMLIFFITLKARLKAVKKFFSSINEETKELRLTNTYANYLLDTNSLTELRSYKAVPWMIKKWKDSYDDWAKKYVREISKNSFKTQTLNVIMDRLLIPLVALLLILVGNVSIFNIILCIQSVEQLVASLNLIISDVAFFGISEEISKNYYSLLEYKENTQERKETINNKVKIVVQNLSYSYGENKNAINNLTLTINPGEKIALVGSNGSGKTTLSKLLLNLYNIQEGKINYYAEEKQLDSNEIVRRNSLFQNYCTYKGFTLLDSITLGDIKSSDIHRAKDLSYKFELERFLDKDTMIGNEFGGVELSGGQAQRLALARCLYKNNCGFICLDEPLASLDPLFETKLLNQFFEYAANSTCVFVTHRLSSCRLADKIIVLDDGNIVEYGTHDELMNQRGKYYELFKTQAELY